MGGETEYTLRLPDADEASIGRELCSVSTVGGHLCFPLVQLNPLHPHLLHLTLPPCLCCSTAGDKDSSAQDDKPNLLESRLSEQVYGQQTVPKSGLPTVSSAREGGSNAGSEGVMYLPGTSHEQADSTWQVSCLLTAIKGMLGSCPNCHPSGLPVI